MAVVNFSGAIHSYVGEAADMTALTVAAGVPIGSRFFSADDGCWYVLIPAGTWAKEVTPAS